MILNSVERKKGSALRLSWRGSSSETSGLSFCTSIWTVLEYLLGQPDGQERAGHHAEQENHQDQASAQPDDAPIVQEMQFNLRCFVCRCGIHIGL